MTNVDILCDADRMDEPKDRLRQARKDAGFRSAAAAAKHFKWNESTYRAHENGQNNIGYDESVVYGRAFNVLPIWILTGGQPTMKEGFDAGKVKELVLQNPPHLDFSQSQIIGRGQPLTPPPFIEPPYRNEMTADLPVYGFAVGGREDNGEFYMNGQIADYVRRPPGVSNMRGVFGVYVCGESMWPRFKPGELVFATNAQTPGIGDDVVVELKTLNPDFDDEADHAARGLIKCLKKRTATKVIVEQYNPPMDLEFDRDEIKALHRVLTSNDLYGA